MKLQELFESEYHWLRYMDDRQRQDLENAMDGLEDEFKKAFVGLVGEEIYVHDETTIGDVPVYWEWTEKQGYVIHHDVDGKDLSPNIQRIVSQKLKEMDPVHNDYKYVEQVDWVKELLAAYDKHIGEIAAKEADADNRYQQRKDDEMTGDR